MVYVRICDGRQILDRKPKRYGTGTRIKYLYSRMLTVTVRSPTSQSNNILCSLAQKLAISQDVDTVTSSV